jgi:hypothetical protein
MYIATVFIPINQLKTFNPMKEDWVIVFASSRKSKATKIKQLLKQSGVETYLRNYTGPIQQAKLYAPSNKAKKAFQLVQTVNT